MSNAARGAVLIGLAVVLGIVLLQVLDKGGGGPAGSSRTTNVTVTTPNISTTPTSAGQTPTTTGSVAGARPRSQVKVIVLNASGQSGLANTKTNALKVLGYQTDNPGNTAQRTGTLVSCRQGYEKELLQLVKDVGGNSQGGAFPSPVPSGVSDQDNCIVVLGK